MAARKRRGPGPSHLLLTPDHAGNVVGIDPHKRTLIGGGRRRARRAGGGRAFPGVAVRAPGALGVGALVRADRALGRGERRRLGPAHRDVLGRPRSGRARCVPQPHRARRSRPPARQVRHARCRADRARGARALAVAEAFKRAGEQPAPTTRTRAADALTPAAPLDPDQPPAPAQRGRAAAGRAAAGAARPTPRRQGRAPAPARAHAATAGAPATPRSRCGCGCCATTTRASSAWTPTNARSAASSPRSSSQRLNADQLCGLSTRSVAELPVEIGDPRRFTTPGFARFNASAPIPASTAEGPRRTRPPPLQPRRQPPRERHPAPHGRHPTALRTTRPNALRQRPRTRPHQNRGPPHPQTPPLRRHPPPDAPRPRTPAPPDRINRARASTHEGP